MTEERFFICPHCADLITQSEIDEELCGGGMGSCYCQFIVDQWDTGIKTFESVCFREFQDYKEIPSFIYYALEGQPNAVLRLEMLATVPKEVLSIKNRERGSCSKEQWVKE